MPDIFIKPALHSRSSLVLLFITEEEYQKQSTQQRCDAGLSKLP